MKKIKDNLKKGKEVALDNKVITSVIILSMIIAGIYIFRTEIVSFFVDSWNDGRKWLLLPFAAIAYKLFYISVINLAKRFAINKGTERIKKLLFHGEIDELFGFVYSIYWINIKNASIVKKTIAFIPLSMLASYAAFKLWLIGATKVILAKFWTWMLAMLFTLVNLIQNSQVIMAWLSVVAFMFLEKYIPWIPRFYNFLSRISRSILDPIWDDYLVPSGNFILDILVKIEFIIVFPFAYIIDKIELLLISFLKGQILKYRGFSYYRRAMRVVKKLNKKQYKTRRKEKHEKTKKLIAMKRENKNKILALEKKHADKIKGENKKNES